MCSINSFYFTIFYHCIRHAVWLSIVLTLLSGVLSAILYNFNEWMKDWSKTINQTLKSSRNIWLYSTYSSMIFILNPKLELLQHVQKVQQISPSDIQNYDKWAQHIDTQTSNWVWPAGNELSDVPFAVNSSDCFARNALICKREQMLHQLSEYSSENTWWVVLKKNEQTVQSTTSWPRLL